MGLRFTIYENPQEFLQRTERFLLKREAENNLPLGLLYQAAEPDSPYKNPFLALAEREAEIIAALIMTPPHYLIWSAGDIPDEAAALVLRELFERNISFPGIVAPKETARKAEAEWKKLTGAGSETVMDQRIYILEKVNDLPYAGGTLSLASEKDEELAAGWISDFSRATPENTLSIEEGRKKARQFISERSLYLWLEDGRPVSMAKKARPTKHGVVVNLVYTPDEERKKGYASACVAALSRELLKSYKFCSLYTDLANPTSNHIYQEIGYKPAADSVMLKWV
ncbi:GNAT family N-acetyltransferase [Bacillus sp. AG4(2022)]|uniref:GNAT family N-acetyltransferase n=1 Tax=Bacillus sp. AG4(2022) TaxID=2962594 RepID=UPI002882178E|nr:GNAT family N-acetyltransferase [Bacillus sp. AG4(2022)]MDT0159116.1 GNAT family N-acetyltransferase [Bacillus sp. AG4(2022)]